MDQHRGDLNAKQNMGKMLHANIKKEGVEGEQQRLKERLHHIHHRIMVMSGKGGVGKSTVAINLAAGLAKNGNRVGILDADIHGPNVPKMLGIDRQQLMGSNGGIEPVEVTKGLKAVSLALLNPDPDKAIIWRGPLKHAAIKQFLADVNWGDLDCLFIDLPPGTGDEPLSVAHLLGNVDGSIIVTTPQEVALLDSRKAVDFSRQLGIPVLGIVENMSGMVCPKCGEKIELFKVGGGLRAAKELGVTFLGSIPIDPQVVDACDAGRPIVTDPANPHAKEAFEHLVRKVIAAMKLSKEI